MGAGKKFALISHVVPPSTSGQAVILQRILGSFSANYCVLLSSQRRSHEGEIGVSLKIPIVSLSTLANTQRMQRGLWILIDGPLFLLQIVVRTVQVFLAMRKEGCNTLVVCTGDFSDVASAYLVCLCSPRTRLIPYYFDYFSYQFPGVFRYFSTALEKKLLKRSEKVIVPNEFLAERLHDRYGVETTLIRNATDVVPLLDIKRNPGMTVFYAGSIYEAHYEVFQVFLKAIDVVAEQNPSIRFEVYTSQEHRVLVEYGIAGKHLHVHGVMDHSKILEIQQSADLLYLPLAFHTDYPEIIDTSCPGKLAEYLASGVPIFAHVPSSCFVGHYLAEKGAGFCVHSLDVAEVAAALQEALESEKDRMGVVASAMKCAADDFSLREAVLQFERAVS